MLGEWQYFPPGASCRDHRLAGGHSRSPRLHGFWLEKHALTAPTFRCRSAPEHFDATVRGLMHAGFAGANVTIPHKLAAFEVCDTVDDTARRAGAVNTLTFRDGKITGANTDGWGFLANLRAHGVDPKAGPALLLGAGGAARAIASALLARGTRVTIANRTAADAERFVRDLPGPRSWLGRRVTARSRTMRSWSTPRLWAWRRNRCGSICPRAAPGTAIADIVYVPLETPCWRRQIPRPRPGRGSGHAAIPGIPGFRGWFGIEPKVDDELRRFVAADLMPR